MENKLSGLEDELSGLKYQKSNNKCKGLYFRYKINNYYNKNYYIIKSKSMRLLKRMSCNGCDSCWQYHEDLVMDSDVDNFHFPKNAKDGEVYKARLVIDGKDWETGYVDGWHWEYDLVKEDKDERI